MLRIEDEKEVEFQPLFVIRILFCECTVPFVFQQITASEPHLRAPVPSMIISISRRTFRR